MKPSFKLLLVLLVTSTSVSGQELKLSMKYNRDRIMLGEKIGLQLILSGLKDKVLVSDNYDVSSNHEFVYDFIIEPKEK